MKNYRFWFGVAFGYVSGYALDLIDWPLIATIPVFLAAFFTAQYLVHKITVS